MSYVTMERTSRTGENLNTSSILHGAIELTVRLDLPDASMGKAFLC